MEVKMILLLRIPIVLSSLMGASSFLLPSSESPTRSFLGRTQPRRARHHAVTETGHHSFYYYSKAPASSVVVVRASESESSSSNDSFDMDELKKRIAFESNPYGALFGVNVDHDNEHQNTVANGIARSNKKPAPASKATDLDRVYIILFQGKGVHSIEYPPESGSNLILAFESKIACDKFATILKKQKQLFVFDNPTVQEVDLKSLETFCTNLGVYAQVVPDGVDLVPPRKRVQKLGQKNPSLRQQRSNLEYVFGMVDGPEYEDDGVLTMEAITAAATTTTTTVTATATAASLVGSGTDAPSFGTSCWE